MTKSNTPDHYEYTRLGGWVKVRPVYEDGSRGPETEYPTVFETHAALKELGYSRFERVDADWVIAWATGSAVRA